MNEKVKFSTFLIIVVLVSAAAAYVTTLSLDSNTDSQNGIPNSQDTEEPSATKIFPSYEVDLSPRDSDSKVTVTSAVSIKDLTIVYKYTSLNGTAYTEEVNYGDYHPTWSPNNVVEPGEIQFQFYRIPQSIISACSSTEAKYDSDGDLIGYEWDVYPRLTVNVYGYS